MIKTTSLMVMAIALTGCAIAQTQQPASVGIANPASTFCVKQGGKLELRNEENGQVGYCHLPDGQVIEEWAYFRSQTECIAAEANKLIGQKRMTDEMLKLKTKAAQIRILMPNQPATMDFRADRLTLVVQPNTQMIQHASCG